MYAIIKKYSWILFCFFSVLNTHSQKNNTQASLYNVGIGGLFAGIGAVINKQPDEKFSKVFFKGLWQGAVGGYLVYESKKMIYKFSNTENYTYAWGSKILNSAGNSIIQNAALNNVFLNKWHINIGFNRIEFETNNRFRVKYKLLPLALYGTIISASKGRFDLNKSLKTGHLIFNSNGVEGNTAYVNSILTAKNVTAKILAHEIIHVYQYEDYFSINLFAKKYRTKLNYKYPKIKGLQKWMYFDSHAWVLKGLYGIEKIGNNCYIDNFFEHEANFYSSKFSCK